MDLFNGDFRDTYFCLRGGGDLFGTKSGAVTTRTPRDIVIKLSKSGSAGSIWARIAASLILSLASSLIRKRASAEKSQLTDSIFFISLYAISLGN